LEVERADDGLGFEIDAAGGVRLVQALAFAQHAMAEDRALGLEIDEIDNVAPRRLTDLYSEHWSQSGVVGPGAITVHETNVQIALGAGLAARG
jgi:hypothetical protein